MNARTIIALVLLTTALSAAGEPVRATSTARVGARILAVPRVVDATVIPDRIVISSADRERGYLLVQVTDPGTRLTVAAGDRDEGSLEPAADGVLRLRAVDVERKVEIVWHGE